MTSPQLVLILAILTACTPAPLAQKPAPPRERVLGVVADFANEPIGPYQKGHLDFWRWPEDFRRRAASMSRLEIVADPTSGKKLLRVQVLDPAVLAQEAIPLLRLAPFYPPEADGLRLHVRVASGQLRAYIGGPTAYFANSDVFTRIEQLAAAAPQPGALDFNLHHPLWRNFRRAGFSTDAARIYYNRWAQEPVAVHLDAGTQGEFFIERIDLIARGEGRPFAEFAASAVRTVKPIADFEDGRRDHVFNLYMADGETEWFDESWKRSRPLRFTPAELTVVHDATRGTKALVSTGPTAEEVQCTGVRTAGVPEANALRVTVQHDAPEYGNTVVGMGRAEAVDFLVFVAPPAKPFPWSEFGPSLELRRFPGPGFDYQLSYRTIRERRDLAFAVYQTRRYLKPREWTTLILPAADFACIYGSGTYRDRFLRNEPLTCGDVIAVAWVNPWCRVGRGRSPVTFRFDDLAFVQVPGRAEEHRSFWQLGDPAGVRWIDGTAPRGRIRHMLLPGDEIPGESRQP